MSFRQLQDALHEAMIGDARDDEIGDALADAEEREAIAAIEFDHRQRAV